MPNPIDYVQQIRDIESKYNLGSYEYFKIHWWQLVRYELSKGSESLNYKANLRPSKKIILKRLCCFFIQFSKLLFLKTDILILRHPRTKTINGIETDIYTDILNKDLNHFNINTFSLDPVRKNELKLPQNTIPLEFIHVNAFIGKKIFYFFNYLLLLKWKKQLQKLDSNFFTPNVIDLIINKTISFIVLRFLFKCFFTIINIKTLIVTNSTGNEALIDAAKYHNIKVYELQHGSPAKDKLNYNYAGTRPKDFYPDVYLSFGSFFEDPLIKQNPKIEQISFGFPYLASTKGNFDLKKIKNRIVVVSQQTIDDLILQWLLNCKTQLDQYDIHLYLHPYYELYDKQIPFADLNWITVKSSSKENIYKGFSEATYVIGGYSTSLFEACEFQANVYVLKEASFNAMDKFIKHNYGSFITINSFNPTNNLFNKENSPFAKYERKNLINFFQKTAVVKS